MLIAGERTIETMVLMILIALTVAGVLIYALSTNGKVSEIGRIVFFAALLVLLFALAGGANLRVISG